MKEGVLEELLTCFPFVPRIFEFMDGMTERTVWHIVKHSDKAISVSNQEVSVSFVGLVPRNALVLTGLANFQVVGKPEVTVRADLLVSRYTQAARDRRSLMTRQVLRPFDGTSPSEMAPAVPAK
jgi:hypothetical protein